jgi:hypothetical protein
MHHLVLRCIFDNASKEEREVLEDGIKTWRKVVDCPADVLWEIRRIENALIADARGHFNRAKELIKQHNINYRLMYKAGIPFVFNPDKCRTFGKG